MVDELNCLIDRRLQYKVVYPGGKFYENRAKITHMGSLYLYEKEIIQKRSFFEILREEITGVNLS